MWSYAAAVSLATLLAGSPRPGEPVRWEAPWDGGTFRRHLDVASGVEFPLPFSGFHFESRHHAVKPEEALRVARHAWTISGPWGAEVTVDAWDTPGGVLLAEWLEAHLSHLYLGEPSLFSGPASARGLPSLGFHHPRTGQAFARRTVVFAAGRRLFRVTCENAEEVRALRIFDEVVRTLEPGDGP